MAKKLLNQIREFLQLKHYSYRNEQAYIDRVRRFLLFHGKCHPAEMGAPEIQAFLAHLAVEGNVSASTQNQALRALLFLYREVLHKEIDPVLLPSAKRPQRLPTVLTRDEVRRLLDRLDGVYKLMAQPLYGSGLRRMERVRLHIQDVDFAYRTRPIRDGKSEKDRIVPLPEPVLPQRRRQIERARLLHQEDLAAGYGEVYLPDALERKYSNAAREFIWPYLFPRPAFCGPPQRQGPPPSR